MDHSDTVMSLLKKACADYKIPGAAVAFLEKSGHAGSYTYGETHNKKKIDVHTRFQVASLSKPLTSWGMMKLLYDKKIDMDSPVNQYLTSWHLSPYNNQLEVSIRQLASHMAGLKSVWYRGSRKSLPRASMISKLEKSYRYIHKPGAEYLYTGAGYTILQLVMEDITGLNFSTFMQRSILYPLGLRDSSFEHSDQNYPNVTLGHLFGFIPLRSTAYAETAAAGFYASIHDYATFVQANIDAYSDGKNEIVLPKSHIKQMHTRVRRDVPYGLGFSVRTICQTKLVYHQGYNIGWRSCFIFSQDLQKGIVIFTNSSGGNSLIAQMLIHWFKEHIDIDPIVCLKELGYIG